MPWSGVFMAVGLLLFLLFLDRFVHRLRPVALASLVAAAGRRASRDQCGPRGRPAPPRRPRRVYGPAGGPAGGRALRAASGAIQAIDTPGSCGWPPSATAWSSWTIRSATSSLPAARSFEVYGRASDPTPPSACSGHRSYSVSSGRSSMTLRSRSGSWSTSRTRPSLPRSTTRRPPCRCSTTSETCSP